MIVFNALPIEEPSSRVRSATLATIAASCSKDNVCVYNISQRYCLYSLYFHTRPDYFFTLDFTLGAYLFHLRGSHPRHLRLRRTSFDLDIQDFTFILILSPLWGIVDEPSPSTLR